jgi:hypothetical protein
VRLEGEGLVFGGGGNVDEHARGGGIIDSEGKVASHIEGRLQTTVVLHGGAHNLDHLDAVLQHSVGQPLDCAVTRRVKAVSWGKQRT